MHSTFTSPYHILSMTERYGIFVRDIVEEAWYADWYAGLFHSPPTPHQVPGVVGRAYYRYIY